MVSPSNQPWGKQKSHLTACYVQWTMSVDEKPGFQKWSKGWPDLFAMQICEALHRKPVSAGESVHCPMTWSTRFACLFWHFLCICRTPGMLIMTRVSFSLLYKLGCKLKMQGSESGYLNIPILITSLLAVSEATVKQTAELMLSTGLADAGYKYVVIDGALLLPSPQNLPIISQFNFWNTIASLMLQDNLCPTKFLQYGQ